MRSKKDIEHLMNEELKRLSLNFELDLTHLFKTPSLISQSKDILEKHIEYIRTSLTDFQKKVAIFALILLEFEKEVSEFPLKPVELDEELYEKLKRYIKGLRVLLNVYLTYAKEINNELEKKSKECITNLEVSHKLYTLELRSTQIELDSRLRELQSNLPKTLIEISTLEDERVTFPDKSEKRLAKGISDVSKCLIKSSINSLESYVKRYKKITFSLILVIFFLLLGLLVLNIGRKFTTFETVSKPETAPSKKISKDVGGEVIEERKKVGKEEISETQSNMTGEKNETMQRPSSQKKLLIVIGLGANIRGGPGIIYPIFSVGKEGVVLERLDEEHGNWIKVKTRDGSLGWISKELVRELDK